MLDNLLHRAMSVLVRVLQQFTELPVVEALACGARVVVPPDNPVLLEVGGQDVIVSESATVEGLARTLAERLRRQMWRMSPGKRAA